MTTSHLPVQFDHYTQVVKEGEELFGERYRAYDSTLQRPVILKLLHPELLRDPAFVEQFRQEAQAAARLDHPNIVQIYSVGAYAETPLLEMAVVEGQSLAKVMADKGVFSPVEMLPLVDAICAALQEAHSQGIIHGNLTLRAVLLRASDNHIWVSDFGLATAIDASLQAELSSKKRRIYALRYRSPEQLQRQVGQVEQIGVPSDLYSLGVILYEMLTGELPVVGNGGEEAVEAHTGDVPAQPAMAQQETDAPAAINAKFSQAIDSVLRKVLAKQPQERFASAEEMAEAFRTAVAQEGAGSSADPPPPDPKPADRLPSSESTPPSKASLPAHLPVPVAPAPVEPKPRGWSLSDIGIIALAVVAAFATWIFWNSRGEPLVREHRLTPPTAPTYTVLRTPSPVPTAQPAPDSAIAGLTVTDLAIAGLVGNPPIQHLGFDDDPEYWRYSTDAYEQEVAGAELVVTVHQSSYNTWQPLSVNSTNYYAEVEVTMEEAADVAAGMVFNYQDDENFYLFLTDPDGYYSVWRLVNDDWETVRDWTQSGAFKIGGGATNRLGIHMDGDRVRLAVNRNVIGEIETLTAPLGGVALYVETYAATDAVTRFGNFRWWDFSMPSRSAIASITARTPTGSFDFGADPDQWNSADDVATYKAIDSALEVTLHQSDWQSWQTLALESTELDNPELDQPDPDSPDLDSPDYYFEADVTLHATSDQVVAGLLFDVRGEDDFYSVSIDVDGYYAIHQRSGGEWTDLQDWIYSPLLQPGGETVNRMGVMVHQHKFWLFANGQVLDTVDVTPSAADVGLIAGTYDETEGKVSFDKVRWWDLTGVALP